MSLYVDPLCGAALAHPVTSSRLYLHLFNKAARTTVAENHSVLSLLITETFCPAYSGGFLRVPVRSCLAAVLAAPSSNLSHSAVAWWSLCLILCGTVVCRLC